MRRLLLQYLPILFLLVFLPVTAQEHKAILYFLDGTDISGYATLKFDKESFYGMPQDKIVFRVSKDEEADTWDEESVSKVVFTDFEFPRTFEYVEIKTFNVSEYYLLELLVSGEVNLYADAMEAWKMKPAKEDEGTLPIPDEKYLRVKRKNETKLTAFGGSKRKIASYFYECPGIIERLNSNVFNVRTLMDIVEYYNDLCDTEIADIESARKKAEEDDQKGE